ncbi:MAG: outer membrane protein assembly factor [Planctomycetes bacterium]|nr:outer membrane protein assembly factor [Planctomycetota bacterium]
MVSLGHCVPQTTRIRYTVQWEGVPRRSLRLALEYQAQTVLNRKRPPVSVRQLIHRARGDIPRLETVLQAQGYYDGRVTVTVQTKSSPAEVVFTVVTGPLYTVGQWIVAYADTNDVTAPPPLPTAGIVQDRPAVAAEILRTEQEFLQQLHDRGYPLCRLAPRDVAIDTEQHKINLTSHIEPGPQAAFGPLTIEGLTQVEAVYVQRRVRWAPGEWYQPKHLRDLEKDLLDSGLFSAARVEPGAALDPNGTLPINVALSERKHRTVRVGGNFVSDEQGIGGRISWEHRNLAGRGQRLRVEAGSSQTEWWQATSYVQPDLGHENLDLHLDLELGQQFPEAYTSESARAGTSLHYHFTRQSQIWGGLALENSHVDQLGVRSRHHFFEVPLGLDLDRRDAPLNAKKGWRFMVQTTPYLDASSDLSFFKNYAEGRFYQEILPVLNTVLAARLGTGVITGASLLDVPADKRFYAGGAGSVRGYAYQSIGPEANGTPLGGVTLVETSLELRTQLDEKFGTVLFLDGGVLMADQFRRTSEEPMRWGAGVGLRYNLGFAPLRFDTAFPLNGDNNDREYQFYVSIGQAF